MLGRQTVAQAHRQIKCLLVVHGFECSTHDDQYIMTDEKHQLLSDKLLGACNLFPVLGEADTSPCLTSLSLRR
jgi:hypothetical protein